MRQSLIRIAEVRKRNPQISISLLPETKLRGLVFFLFDVAPDTRVKPLREWFTGFRKRNIAKEQVEKKE